MSCCNPDYTLVIFSFFFVEPMACKKYFNGGRALSVGGWGGGVVEMAHPDLHTFDGMQKNTP